MKSYITNGIKHGPVVSIDRPAKSIKGTARVVKERYPEVRFVADSLQAVRVDVRERDRNTAEPQEFTKCAFARAACRGHKSDGAFIGIRTSYLVFGDTAIRFFTPSTVAREVVVFDRHEDFATGIYRLSAVSPSQRLGKAQNKNKDPKRRKIVNGGKLIRHTTTRVRSIT